MMRVFTCTDHDGHYPVGVASVIVAANIERAGELLDAELVKRGLKPGGWSILSLPTEAEGAFVLNDGDY